MTNKKVFTERDRKDAEGPYMDNPENLRTDKESIYDMHEDMKTVDSIPLEDLKLEEREEKHHHDSKSNSSSEEKFRGSGLKKQFWFMDNRLRNNSCFIPPEKVSVFSFIASPRPTNSYVFFACLMTPA